LRLPLDLDGWGRTGRLTGGRLEAQHAVIGRLKPSQKPALGWAPSSFGLMTTPEDNPDPENESRATETPAPAPETPTRLQQAAGGLAESQAWKGQQIAKGWRKLVDALRGHKAEGR
jgi:hypothetical protein